MKKGYRKNCRDRYQKYDNAVSRGTYVEDDEGVVVTASVVEVDSAVVELVVAGGGLKPAKRNVV